MSASGNLPSYDSLSPWNVAGKSAGPACNYSTDSTDFPPPYDEISEKALCLDCLRTLQGREVKRKVLKRKCRPHTIPRLSKSSWCCLRVQCHGSSKFVARCEQPSCVTSSTTSAWKRVGKSVTGFLCKV